MSTPDLPRGLDAVAYWQQHLRGWEYVYVIRSDEQTPIKIGRAIDVEARLKGLQTGNPYRLKVIGAIPGNSDIEACFHRHLRLSRMRGEWFDGPAVQRFLDWFDRHSDQLILRFQADGTVPHEWAFRLKLAEPDVRPKRGKGLRSPNIRGNALLGHRWRTTTGRTAEITVRHVEPDPLPPEQSREFEIELAERGRHADLSKFGWNKPSA